MTKPTKKAWLCFDEGDPMFGTFATAPTGNSVRYVRGDVLAQREKQARREALTDALAEVRYCQNPLCLTCGKPKADNNVRHPFKPDRPTNLEEAIQDLLEKELKG